MSRCDTGACPERDLPCAGGVGWRHKYVVPSVNASNDWNCDHSGVTYCNCIDAEIFTAKVICGGKYIVGVDGDQPPDFRCFQGDI